jgi:predicted amidophosphoribosyltransferase
VNPLLSLVTHSSEFLLDASSGLSSLFFPRICPFCQGEGGCIAIGEGNETNERGRTVCLDFWNEPPSIRYIDGVPIYSVRPYDDRAMKVVLAAKERGERSARKFLAQAIESVISEKLNGTSPLLLIPIPSTDHAIRKRGEDFILSLARTVARRVRSREILIAPVLRWIRRVEDQSLLSIQERIENLASACQVDEKKVQKWVVRNRLPETLEIALIDDVITSGATLSAAISAISHSSLGSRSSLVGITACHSARPF